MNPKHPQIHDFRPGGMAQTYITHLCRNEKVRKSELTRKKQRLLWEVLFNGEQ